MILPDNEVVVTMDRNEATARHLPTGITASFGSHHWAHDNQKTAREKLCEKVGRHYFDQMLQPWLRHEDTKYVDDRYRVIAMPTKEQAEAMADRLRARNPGAEVRVLPDHSVAMKFDLLTTRTIALKCKTDQRQSGWAKPFDIHPE